MLYTCKLYAMAVLPPECVLISAVMIGLLLSLKERIEKYSALAEMQVAQRAIQV